MPNKDPIKRRENHKAYMVRYLADPERRAKHLARVKVNDAKRRAALKARLSEWRKDGCVRCGEKDEACLAAHHLDPAQKDIQISQILGGRLSLETLEAELAKCACLCHNCHTKLHAGRFTL